MTPDPVFPDSSALIKMATGMAAIEAQLLKVQRWTNYQQSSRARPQTTLAHTATIAVLGARIIRAIMKIENKPPDFDPFFVMCALAEHDLGEIAYADDGQDTLYDNRSVSKDEQEIDAFIRLNEQMGREWIADLEPFLLQYAARTACPSERVKALIMPLSDMRMNEFRVFDAIERTDYLFYALYEYAYRGNTRIAVHVLRRHHPVLLNFSRHYPGYATEFYTEDFVRWAGLMIERYDLFDEQAIPDRR